MMCKKPYIRAGSKVTPLAELPTATQEERLACTPFPCGQCLPCRINKARVWQHRLILESYTNKPSIFVSLTYNDENLPNYKSLDPYDVTKFLKRLRYLLGKKRRISYYYVGEYGTQTKRPHYHLFIFGMGNISNDRVLLEKAWSIKNKPMGYVHVGEVNPHSIEYCVSYITKSMNKKDERFIEMYGDKRHPEFQRMSRNPALGVYAVKLITNKLSKDKYFKGRLREVCHGKKTFPLGRFLQGKADEFLNSPSSDIFVDFWVYQQQMFEKHFKEGCTFIDSVVGEKKQKRHVQFKRWRDKQSRKVRL